MVRISVDLPEEVAQALARLADDSRSTPAALLSRWATEAVATRAALLDRLTSGLADLEAGRTADHEDVMAELDAWAAGVEATQRKAG